MTTQATQTYPNSNVITMNDELKTQLRNVPILSSLKDDELYCIDTVHEVRVQDGEYIARQGEMAHFFWILLEGELQFSQTQSDGRELDM
jgi:CRP-like cAMP-binding protein